MVRDNDRFAAIAKVFAKVIAKVRGTNSISLIVRTQWRFRGVESYALSKFQPPTTLGDPQNVEKAIRKNIIFFGLGGRSGDAGTDAVALDAREAPRGGR